MVEYLNESYNRPSFDRPSFQRPSFYSPSFNLELLNGDIMSTINLNSNALIITPSDDLAANYAALKSSGNDARMGALSKDNRRTLLLTPGVYTITSTLTLDTDFVDISGITGNPKDTIILNAAGTCITQTCASACLSNFTAKTTKATGVANALYLNNTKSYTGCTTSGSVISGTGIGIGVNADQMGILYGFVQALATNERRSRLVSCDKVFISGDGLAGGWYNIIAATDDTITVQETLGTHIENIFIDVVPLQSVYRNMIFASYFDQSTPVVGSYGGSSPADYDSGRQSVASAHHIGGVWIDCHTTSFGWRVQKFTVDLALAGTVADNGGYAQFTTAQPHKLAQYQEVYFVGTTNHSPAGYTLRSVVTSVDSATQFTIHRPYVTNEDVSEKTYISFDADTCGIWINCTSQNYSFGGDLARFIDGYFYNCVAGDTSFGGCTAVGSPLTGDFYYCKAGKLSFGLSLPITGYLEGCEAGGASFSGAGQGTTGWNYNLITGTVKNCKTSGKSSTANSFGMKGLYAGAGVTGRVINCQNGTEADYKAGTCNAAAYTIFTGSIKGCAPDVPIAKAASYTISAFENGATFTNAGASGTITLTLPPAVVGLKYDFRLAAAQAIRLEPGSETIVAGVGESAGDYIESDTTVGSKCRLECIVAGQWQMYDVLGTWNDE